MKQLKSSQLKQLSLENKSYVCDKFSKVLLTLLAAKVKEGLEGGEGRLERKVENIHKMIEHVMDSGPARSLGEYLSWGEELVGKKGSE